MLGIQLWSDIKEYFEKNGVKEDQAEKNMSYKVMYDENYCSWLSHFYKCLFYKDCNLDYEDIDDLVEAVQDAQYEIETELKRRFNKLIQGDE